MKTSEPKCASPRSPGKFVDRMTSMAFLAYLFASGAAVLSLAARPEWAHAWGLQQLARATGSLFAVVENASYCGDSVEARRVLVAFLVLATHACFGGVIALAAWERRDLDMREPLRWVGLRDLLGGLATILLALGLYWYQFFALGRPVAGQAAGASYLCWHPIMTWVVFTGHAVFSVGFLVAILAMLVTFVGRSSRWIRQVVERNGNRQ